MSTDIETISMLRDSAQRYAAEHYDFLTRWKILDQALGCSAQAWNDYADFGWLALRLPEDDGGIDADPSLGGELEFMDPRGPGPAMYAPQLAYGSAGLSVGANETVRPKSGRLVMFPAWLLHQVRPYRGTARRISIAFNLSL